VSIVSPRKFSFEKESGKLGKCYVTIAMLALERPADGLPTVFGGARAQLLKTYGLAVYAIDKSEPHRSIEKRVQMVDPHTWSCLFHYFMS